MSTNNISVRFTDENYVTKNELSVALGMSSIDPFWRQIQAYRAQYQRKVGLKNIHQIPFFLTFSPVINQKLNSFIAKVSKLENKLVNVDENILARFKKEKTIDILRGVTALEGKKIGELSLRAMVNGTYRESNADHTSVLNYLNAIRGFFDTPVDTLNDEFLAKYLCLLLDEEELLDFYRSTNLDNTYRFATTILGRDYEYAPADLIPSLMEEFFSFTGTGGGDPFAKSIMGLFYFDYIKPFNSYNRELGCFIARAIVSSFGYEKAACYIDFENIFRDAERYQKLSLETQRSGDLTYVALHALPIVNDSLDKALDLLAQLEVSAISDEQYVEAKVPAVEVLKEVPVETKTEIKEVIKPVEVKEPIKPQENSVPAAEYKEVVKPVTREEKVYVSVPKEPEMSSSDAKEYAKYIQETNPSIRKQQAVFYSTHCSMNHYYSINDYKKATRCVYETARTSMDNLAAEGFYKKLKVKNKFVYTPVKQGGK